MARGGWSWKRALGISKAKSKFARKTGIPTTKAGRRNKMRRLATCGCFVYVLAFILVLATLLIVLL